MTIDNDVKLCTNCQHGKLIYSVLDCHHELNMRRSLVTGRDCATHSCEFLRDDPSRCGPDGAWFRARLL